MASCVWSMSMYLGPKVFLALLSMIIFWQQPSSSSPEDPVVTTVRVASPEQIADRTMDAVSSSRSADRRWVNPPGTDPIEAATAFPTQVHEAVVKLRRQERREARIAARVAARQEARADARAEAVAQPDPVPAPPTTTTSTSSSGLNWAALADCESSGSPTVVSSNGLWFGLYQFTLGTWASVGGTGLPTEASAEEQTMRAQILFDRSGAGPWPNCGYLLFS